MMKRAPFIYYLSIQNQDTHLKQVLYHTEATWDNLGITRQFILAIKDMGFDRPTEVQQKCIPPAAAGQSVIGIAQTGTGKTAAYGLPILMQLKFNKTAGPRALIVLPAKELVIQVAAQMQLLSKNTDLQIVALYGGVGPKSQIEALQKHPDIIVSTPGRFEELYRSGAINSKTISKIVLDEADRLMDMNFMPQLRRIFEWLPPKRQTLMYSATFPDKVQRLVDEFVDFPLRIEITPQSTPAVMVAQQLFETPNFKTKINLLVELLKKHDFKKVIVFVRTKESATELGKYIERIAQGGVRVVHSNKSQNSRFNAIREFGQGLARILVTTDVTARGIDIPEVSHVINFDVPTWYQDYVHRIGRTGRAFATGVAVTFVTPADQYYIKGIEKLMNEKIVRMPLPASVTVVPTPFAENQLMLREIDRQKKLEDPDYRGAFHERKK